MSNEDATAPDQKAKPLAVAHTAIAFAARLDDPLDAVNKLGQAFADSAMFGCSNVAQGRVLAMHCLCENKSPIAVMREYHLIGGNLSMKSDVMLAKFRQAGGDHIIVERTPARAAIEMKWKRRTQAFEVTWDQVKSEDYVFCKDKKTLKDNWSTPRRRMQMLWARLISDAVRAVAPECMAGHYTPEDLGATGDPDAIDAEFTVASKPEAEQKPETAPEKPPEPKPEPKPEVTPVEQPANVTREQLLEMKALKDGLEYGADVWTRVLEKFGVTTAKDLSFGEANRVLAWLTKKSQQIAAKNELNQWAKDALNPKGESKDG